MAGLHSKILDAPPSNFLHFHAVFRKIWPNNRLAPPLVWLVIQLLLDWKPRQNWYLFLYFRIAVSFQHPFSGISKMYRNVVKAALNERRTPGVEFKS